MFVSPDSPITSNASTAIPVFSESSTDPAPTDAFRPGAPYVTDDVTSKPEPKPKPVAAKRKASAGRGGRGRGRGRGGSGRKQGVVSFLRSLFSPKSSKVARGKARRGRGRGRGKQTSKRALPVASQPSNIAGAAKVKAAAGAPDDDDVTRPQSAPEVQPDHAGTSPPPANAQLIRSAPDIHAPALRNKTGIQPVVRRDVTGAPSHFSDPEAESSSQMMLAAVSGERKRRVVFEVDSNDDIDTLLRYDPPDFAEDRFRFDSTAGGLVDTRRVFMLGEGYFFNNALN